MLLDSLQAEYQSVVFLRLFLFACLSHRKMIAIAVCGSAVFSRSLQRIVLFLFVFHRVIGQQVLVQLFSRSRCTRLLEKGQICIETFQERSQTSARICDLFL